MFQFRNRIRTWSWRFMMASTTTAENMLVKAFELQQRIMQEEQLASTKSSSSTSQVAWIAVVCVWNSTEGRFLRLFLVQKTWMCWGFSYMMITSPWTVSLEGRGQILQERWFGFTWLLRSIDVDLDKVVQDGGPEQKAVDSKSCNQAEHDVSIWNLVRDRKGHTCLRGQRRWCRGTQDSHCRIRPTADAEPRWELLRARRIFKQYFKLHKAEAEPRWELWSASCCDLSTSGLSEHYISNNFGM